MSGPFACTLTAMNTRRVNRIVETIHNILFQGFMWAMLLFMAAVLIAWVLAACSSLIRV